MRGPFSLRDFGATPALAGVLSYLNRHGWTAEDDRGLLRCESPPDVEGQRILKFLPATETAPDYPLRLEDLVRVLTVEEDRPACDILQEMRDLQPSRGAGLERLAERTLETLRRFGPATLSQEEIDAFADQWAPAVLNAELETAGLNPAVRRAILFTRIARLLPDHSGGFALFARLVQECGALGGTTPSPQLRELFALARRADPAAPDEVLLWLLARAPRPATPAVQKRRRPRKTP